MKTRVGVDNDCFQGLDERQFLAMLEAVRRAAYRDPPSLATIVSRWLPGFGIAPHPATAPAPAAHPGLLWVAVPDVPMDARATARRWAEYAWLMTDLPLALCVQDGIGDIGIPWAWPNLRCLFLAGSTEFKLSREIAEIAAEGKRRGRWIRSLCVAIDRSPSARARARTRTALLASTARTPSRAVAMLTDTGRPCATNESRIAP